MNPQRFNVFNQVHKALRAFMFDTVMLMQQTDMSNPFAAKPVIDQVDLLLDIFDANAYYEDTHILELAKRHDPEMIMTFENEHETGVQMTENLRRYMFRYRVAQNAAEKFAAGNNLYYALNEFIAFNLTHMNKEEQQLNNLLWQHFSDADIMQMERAMHDDIPPEKMAIYFKWIVKGLNDTELAEYFKKIEQDAPYEFYQSLVNECRNELSQERYNCIVVQQPCKVSLV